MPDNYDAWEAHDEEQESNLDKFPKCIYCGDRLTEEYVYVIDGETMCEKCLNDNHRKPIEDFID